MDGWARRAEGQRASPDPGINLAAQAGETTAGLRQTAGRGANQDLMTALHRPRIVLAILAAAFLMGTLATPADARVPRAKRYHVGGRITLDTNLRSTSGVTAWAIDEFLAANTRLPKLGAAFIAAERKYKVNARFLLAAALHESGWGTNYISRVKHNLFGLNAYDRDPLRYATAHATYGANINATAKFIRASYLTPGGRWWGGQPTLRSMQQFWSSSRRWGEGVSRIANSIHLGSLASRKITFAAPVATGPLHGGERTSVNLAWSGGAIPRGVTFVATWRPIELDSEVIAATMSPPVVPVPGDADAMLNPVARAATDSLSSVTPPGATVPRRSTPKAVAARKVRSKARSITLAVAAPPEPGRYVLDVELRDAGRSELPTREQVHIPGTEVRVFGDLAVSYDVEPGPDGTGDRDAQADRAADRNIDAQADRHNRPATPTPEPAATPTPEDRAARPGGDEERARERSGAITCRGGWHDAPHGGYMGGDVRWSTTPGATATFTFTGSSVRWVGPKGPTRGLALVLIDGRAVARVNLFRSTFVARTVLFRRSFDSPGRHTLTIKVLRAPGHQHVAIDGFTVRS